jgi:peptidoglycan/xylan/chitin deacetylase (PgdA/CDA1 family)
MAFGRSTTLPVKTLVATVFIAASAGAICATAEKSCNKPLYLTFDTGHMGVAPLIADVLNRQQVKVTFFGAHERTQEGDGSLGDHWAPDHVYWSGDVTGDPPQFRVKPSAGPDTDKTFTWTAAQYCEEIRHANQRLQAMTGQAPLPLFRAPGGKTSPALLAAAKDCGYAHVGWAPAGFLGDELSSERVSNAQLLAQSLRNIRGGDILMAHLGIWSRKDPWAPAVLEPLIVGLKERGFCFRTLREHPDYIAWISSHPQ